MGIEESTPDPLFMELEERLRQMEEQGKEFDSSDVEGGTKLTADQVVDYVFSLSERAAGLVTQVSQEDKTSSLPQ